MLFHMTEEELRNTISACEQEDYDVSEKTSFIDILDSGLSALKCAKNKD